MSIEITKLLFWKRSPDGLSLVDDFQTRIAVVSLRLKEGNESFPIQDSRQEIPKEKITELVNGKGKYLKKEVSTPPTIYASVSEEKSWIAVGSREKRVTYLLRIGENPLCVLEKKLPSGRWGRARKIGEVSLSEVETIIKFAEEIATKPLLGRPSSS